MEKKLVKESGQQGDIVFIKIDKLPDNAIKHECKTIQESTHPHVLEGGDIYVTENERFFVAKENACVNHDTHETLYFENGIWQFGKILEKGIFSGLVAPVVD